MSGLEIKNTENFLDVKIKKFLKSANKKKKKRQKKTSWQVEYDLCLAYWFSI